MNNFVLIMLSSVFYCASLSWGSLLGYWLCLEIAGLVLLASFFNYWSNFNRYLAVLFYLLIAGLSSCFLFSGLSSESPSLLLLLSFFIKVGVFPFTSWLVFVYTCCSWPVFYALAVISKVGYLYIVNINITLVNNVLLCFTMLLVCFFYGL